MVSSQDVNMHPTVIGSQPIEQTTEAKQMIRIFG